MTEEQAQTFIRQAVQEVVSSTSNRAQWQNTALAIVGVATLLSGLVAYSFQAEAGEAVKPVEARVVKLEASQDNLAEDVQEIKSMVKNIAHTVTDLRIQHAAEVRASSRPSWPSPSLPTATSKK